MSLEDIKKEKIRIALEEKGYSESPENFSFAFLCKRLQDEVFELEWELGVVPSEVDGCLLGKNPPDVKEAKKECADVSNIVDFVFKKLTGLCVKDE